jgi:hypothetical protein
VRPIVPSPVNVLATFDAVGVSPIVGVPLRGAAPATAVEAAAADVKTASDSRRRFIAPPFSVGHVSLGRRAARSVISTETLWR